MKPRKEQKGLVTWHWTFGFRSLRGVINKSVRFVLLLHSKPYGSKTFTQLRIVYLQSPAQQERLADGVAGFLVAVGVADHAVRDTRVLESGLQRLIGITARRDNDLIAGQGLLAALFVGNDNALRRDFLDRRVHKLLDMTLIQMAVHVDLDREHRVGGDFRAHLNNADVTKLLREEVDKKIRK